MPPLVRVGVARRVAPPRLGRRRAVDAGRDHIRLVEGGHEPRGVPRPEGAHLALGLGPRAHQRRVEQPKAQQGNDETRAREGA